MEITNMGMKVSERKKLWGNSGNTCSFPDCAVELAPQEANKVIGEEAHIKGEKPGAPRYDPQQLQEDRDGYQNHILLCPTHHVVIDDDPKKWTVDKLRDIKAKHEQEVVDNRQFPPLRRDLEKLVQQYTGSDQELGLSVPEIIEDRKDIQIVRVDASVEGGVETEIKVLPGQTITFFARGLISYDGGIDFTNPDGVICNEYGLPLLFLDNAGNMRPAVWPHENAYRTNGSELGRIGSLFGWINKYTEENSFFIGTKREIEVTEEGYLHLAVNDARGTYGDNDGEFRVDIRVTNTR